MPHTVEIKDVAERHVAAVKFTAAASEMAEKFGAAFGEVMQYIAQVGAQLAGGAIGYYEQLGGDRFDVRAGFVVTSPVEGNGRVMPFVLPAGRVATTMHIGSYETLREAYAAVAAQAKAQGAEVDPTSPMWEEYLTGPEVPPEQTQTLVYWPVKGEAASV